MRSQLLKADPPKLNTLPLGSFVGEVSLTKEQYKRQFAIAPSFYILFNKNSRLFCGLKNISEDQSTANYYWMLHWDDPEAVNSDWWGANASQKEMLDFAQERLRDLDPRFAELPTLTKPEGMVVPLIRVRDWVPDKLPMGRVTLLGDAAHPMTFCMSLQIE